jgi:ParB family transcriptional regulator, chromosome partitioning protein
MRMGIGNVSGLKGLERAQDAQTITALEEENLALQTQLAELKAQRSADGVGALSQTDKVEYEQQIEALTAQLAAHTGEHEISVDLIDPDPEQPRKVFATSVIQERANSLKKNGQLTPIIVIPQTNGRYKLFEGELRWRGQKVLERQSIRAVFLPEKQEHNPIDLFREQVVTSLHSQGLHDLDLADAIVKIAVARCPDLAGREQDVPKLLNSTIRRLERHKLLPDFNHLRLAEESEQDTWVQSDALKSTSEQAVFQTILELQLNPNSINTGAMRLLNLAPDLKAAIREAALEAGKARELNRLSAKNLGNSEAEAQVIRQNAVDQTIEQRLSFLEVKGLVDKLLKQAKGKPNDSDKGQRIVQQVSKLSLDDLSNQDLILIKQALEEKLKEVKRAISSEDF